MGPIEIQKRGSHVSQTSVTPFYKSSDTSNSDSFSSLRRLHVSVESELDGERQVGTSFGTSNLLVTLLVLTICGDLTFSVNKYGVLFDPMAFITKFMPSMTDLVVVVMIAASLLLLAEITRLCETMLAEAKFSTFSSISIVEYTILSVILVVPILYSYNLSAEKRNLLIDPTIYCIILWMKLFSYMAYNRWMHADSTRFSPKGQTGLEGVTEKNYKNALTRKNLLYFLMAPTLCYEAVYPRRKSVRLGFIVTKLVNMLFVLMTALLVCQQLMVPTMISLTKSLSDRMYPDLYLGVIRLAVYVNIVWICSFYVIYHCYLNILGELLTFGDRCFYLDWWNSCSVVYFWKSWNVPVHRWFKRHVYEPMFSFGYNRFQCSVLVFLLSAVFHEYVAWLILKLPTIWMFMVMVIQIPMSLFLDLIPSPRLRNLVFLLSLIVAQVVGMMLYAYQYYSVYEEVMITAGIDVSNVVHKQ